MKSTENKHNAGDFHQYPCSQANSELEDDVSLDLQMHPRRM